MNNIKTCTLCLEEITAFRPLTHYKCPSCMERGFIDRLVCESCIKKWPNECPFDRQQLNNDLKAEIIRTPIGSKLYVIVKQKQCCCLKIKKCLKTNISIIQQLPNCYTIFSWWQAISQILLLHISIGFIAYVFAYGICANEMEKFCWICILAGILNIFASILLLWLIFGFINDKHRIVLSVIYGFFGSLSFITAISTDIECNFRFLGLALFIPAFCSWSVCGYKSNLNTCE